MTMRNLPENRKQTIQDIWTSNQWLYTVLGIVIGLLLYPAIDYIFSDLTTLFQNLIPAALTVLFTVMFINTLFQRHSEKNRIRDLQDSLIRQAGSPVHNTTMTAIETLRKKGWLGRRNMPSQPDDPLALLQHANLSNADLHELDFEFTDLYGAHFTNANLHGVNLGHAILENTCFDNATLIKADLWQATLINATLDGSDLSEAGLIGANLTGATFREANLRQANFQDADLTGAILTHADLSQTNFCVKNLKGADLRGANLCGAKFYVKFLDTRHTANFEGALIDDTTQFDRSTVLPDGKTWFPNRDFAKYGAEIRNIVDETSQTDDRGNLTKVFTFADGTQRRWQRGIGWLDE